jgi:hypothetical protein
VALALNPVTAIAAAAAAAAAKIALASHLAVRERRDKDLSVVVMAIFACHHSRQVAAAARVHRAEMRQARHKAAQAVTA